MAGFIPIHIPRDWSDINEKPSVMDFPITYVKWIIDLAKTLNYLTEVAPEIPEQIGNDYKLLTTIGNQLFWKKISEFPNGLSLLGSDKLIVEQLTGHKKVSISDILALIPPSGGSGNFKDNDVPIGIQNRINVTFTTTLSYIAGSTKLYLNGLRLTPGITNDYEELGTNQIRFIEAPYETDKLLIDYRF